MRVDSARLGRLSPKEAGRLEDSRNRRHLPTACRGVRVIRQQPSARGLCQPADVYSPDRPWPTRSLLAQSAAEDVLRKLSQHRCDRVPGKSGHSRPKDRRLTVHGQATHVGDQTLNAKNGRPRTKRRYSREHASRPGRKTEPRSRDRSTATGHGRARPEVPVRQRFASAAPHERKSV